MLVPQHERAVVFLTMCLNKTPAPNWRRYWTRTNLVKVLDKEEREDVEAVGSNRSGNMLQWAASADNWGVRPNAEG